MHVPQVNPVFARVQYLISQDVIPVKLFYFKTSKER